MEQLFAAGGRIPGEQLKGRGRCELKGQCEWIKGTQVNFSSASQGTAVCDYICRNKWLHDCDVTESLMQTVFNYHNEDGQVSIQPGF